MVERDVSVKQLANAIARSHSNTSMKLSGIIPFRSGEVGKIEDFLKSSLADLTSRKEHREKLRVFAKLSGEASSSEQFRASASPKPATSQQLAATGNQP